MAALAPSHIARSGPDARAVAAGGGQGTPAAPSAQVVGVIGPLQSQQGTHQVTLSLQPEGLGTVRATVTVNAQQVVVQLSTETPAGHDALAQALPLLRQQLGAQGAPATIVLADGSAGQRQGMGGQPQGRSGRPGERALETETSTIVASRPLALSGGRLVDVQL